MGVVARFRRHYGKRGGRHNNIYDEEK